MGLILFVVPLRVAAYGWVETLMITPVAPFRWVESIPDPTLPRVYAVLLALAISAVGVASGRWVRAFGCVYLVGFVWLELLDKSLYLNHYVLISLLLGALLVYPCDGRGPPPSWWVRSMRLLLASVYVWAGVWKLTPDWLCRAEPLQTWLLARQDMPVFGPLLAHPGTAFGMSWGGALYDLSIPFLLMAPATRKFAFGWVVVFHLVTWWLFPIGVFPWVMLAGSLWFLPVTVRRTRLRGPVHALWWASVVMILAFPARSWLLPGHVPWHEQGYRFSWRVLLIEKTGFVEYRLVFENGEERRFRPSIELTELQHKQMRTQPDMILQYGRFLGRRAGASAVYVDSWASLNGRVRQRLVREDVDLMTAIADGPVTNWIYPLDERER